MGISPSLLRMKRTGFEFFPGPGSHLRILHKCIKDRFGASVERAPSAFLEDGRIVPLPPPPGVRVLLQYSSSLSIVVIDPLTDRHVRDTGSLLSQIWFEVLKVRDAFLLEFFPGVTYSFPTCSAGSHPVYVLRENLIGERLPSSCSSGLSADISAITVRLMWTCDADPDAGLRSECKIKFPIFESVEKFYYSTLELHTPLADTLFPLVVKYLMTNPVIPSTYTSTSTSYSSSSSSFSSPPPPPPLPSARLTSAPYSSSAAVAVSTASLLPSSATRSTSSTVGNVSSAPDAAISGRLSSPAPEERTEDSLKLHYSIEEDSNLPLALKPYKPRSLGS